MSVEARQQNGDAPELRQIYIAQLREHTLALVWLGYQRMKPAAFAAAEEDAITGELVRQMKDAIQDESAPSWTEHYSVCEQVRSNVVGTLGKRRPIVDVEFERHRQGPRPYLRFEAKRLGRGSGISAYLGNKGLGAFLIGHYSTTHQEAGMLGYVQTGSEDSWAAKLSTELQSRPTRHRLAEDGAWRQLVLTGAPPHAYQTKHLDTHSLPLLVVHILLRFTAVSK